MSDEREREQPASWHGASVTAGGVAARTPTHGVPGLEPPPGPREYSPILIGRPHDTARSTPGFGPLSALPPPPGDRRPNSRFRAAAPPSRRLFFSPDAAAPAYNDPYMRPLDALTRHASSWGRLVTISVFAVLTAALVMAGLVGGDDRGAHRHLRRARHGQRHHARHRRRRPRHRRRRHPARCSQVSRTDRFAFGHPAEAERVVRGGDPARSARAARRRCSAAARVATACACPTTSPSTVRTDERQRVASSGYRGSARVDTTHGRRRLRRLLRLQPADARADAGDVRAVAACAPERLQLRSRQGRVDALVPPGRYRVDAESDDGQPQRPRRRRRRRTRRSRSRRSEQPAT